jgi:hypothetical protein
MKTALRNGPSPHGATEPDDELHAQVPGIELPLRSETTAEAPANPRTASPNRNVIDPEELLMCGGFGAV